MTIKFSSSVLLVKDLNLSRNFYEGLLEQSVALDHGECLGFAGGFALWQREHALKIMQLKQEESLNGNGEPQHHFELYFEVDDLDSILEKITLGKFELVHGIFEQPWGQRVLRVYDPDRHLVELGEPMSVVIRRFLQIGMRPEEVAERTSMPLEIVLEEVR